MPYTVQSDVTDHQNSHVQYATFYEDKKSVELYCDTKEHGEQLIKVIYCMQTITKDTDDSFSDFDMTVKNHIVTLTGNLKSALALMKNKDILSGWFIQDIYNTREVSQLLEHCATDYLKKEQVLSIVAVNSNPNSFFHTQCSNMVADKGCTNPGSKTSENKDGSTASISKKNLSNSIKDGPCIENQKVHRQYCSIL